MNWKYEEEKKSRKVKWTVLLLFLILLLLGIAIGILLVQGKSNGGDIAESNIPTENPGNGVGLIIDPNSETGLFSEKDNTAEQDVAISGRGSMTIPANKREIAVDFYNPKENEDRYYQTFELRLYDSSEQEYEVLYTSGLVEPGKHINRITLSRGLEKGVYEAVVHVQPYRMNVERTPTNNVNIKIKLTVE